jgi:cytochrome c peroxidase
MKHPKHIFFIFFLGIIAMNSCEEESAITDLPDEPTEQEILDKYVAINISDLENYSSPDYPVHYDNNILNMDNSPIDNPITNIGASLGRVLFYDENLSVNGTISCASCHKQDLGFTDENQFSKGFEDGLTGAHSMRLGNINFYVGDAMFWDKRAVSVEDQSTKPIQDEVEMGFDAAHGGLDALINKMNGLEYYPILFAEAFGDKNITENRVQKALSQFIRSMVSTNSKFDDGFAQVFNQGGQGQGPGGNIMMDFPNFTEQENLGKRLFAMPPQTGGAACLGCHQAPTFVLNENSRSNGLDQGETTIFKSPSLKNIGLTGPYMHDGRFATLMEVVEHYNSGIQAGPALDNRLRMGPNTQNLNLTNQEKHALVAFLNTLNDDVLITDPKFSDPFK